MTQTEWIEVLAISCFILLGTLVHVATLLGVAEGKLRKRDEDDRKRKLQEISFAYRNLKMHNPDITRADIEKAADDLDREGKP